MTTESEQESIHEEIERIAISEFLETCSPNRVAHISDLGYRMRYSNGGYRDDMLSTPEIQLHCPNDSCNGVRFFRCVSGRETHLTTEFEFIYVTYRCSNCQDHQKTYSLAAKLDAEKSGTGELYKFGELPTFGPPTPPKLVKLIGPDRETFLKGRRCENQGLGIGAFIYYRRVVENQKNRILNEIIKVSEKIGAPEERVEVLRRAVSETQFSKALDMAKDAIPESLLINGHSPVLLLHSALSEGVHALSDEECLDLASSIRVVLGELSERLGQALKDEAELSKALSTLMNHRKG
ncbi:hypothetical protein H3222_03665 [Pseudomonas chengduensis]|jgi:hypothetical protein|nr:hypothetical protein [Pseudomonas chengduensis]